MNRLPGAAPLGGGGMGRGKGGGGGGRGVPGALGVETGAQKKIRNSALICSPSGASGFVQILPNSIKLNPSVSPSE